MNYNMKRMIKFVIAAFIVMHTAFTNAADNDTVRQGPPMFIWDYDDYTPYLQVLQELSGLPFDTIYDEYVHKHHVLRYINNSQTWVFAKDKFWIEYDTGKYSFFAVDKIMGTMVYTPQTSYQIKLLQYGLSHNLIPPDECDWHATFFWSYTHVPAALDLSKQLLELNVGSRYFVAEAEYIINGDISMFYDFAITNYQTDTIFHELLRMVKESNAQNEPYYQQYRAMLQKKEDWLPIYTTKEQLKQITDVLDKGIYAGELNCIVTRALDLASPILIYGDDSDDELSYQLMVLAYPEMIDNQFNNPKNWKFDPNAIPYYALGRDFKRTRDMELIEYMESLGYDVRNTYKNAQQGKEE